MAEQSTIAVEAIEIKIEDNASHATDALAQRFEALNGSVQRAGGGLGMLSGKFETLKRHSLTMIASVTGLTLGLGALATKAWAAAKETAGLEKQYAQVILASNKWAKGVSPAEKVAAARKEGKAVSEALSDEMMDKFGADKQQVGQVFKQLSGTMMGKLGLGTKGTADMTKMAMGAQAAWGMDAGGVAGQTSTLLQMKRVGRGTDPFTSMLRTAFPDAAKLRKMGPEAVLSQIQKKMKEVEEQGKLMSTGLSANVARISEFFEQLLESFALPILQAVSKVIAGWNEKLKAAGSSIRDIAEKWGAKLLQIFERAVQLGSYLVDNWKTILAMWVAFKTPVWLTAMQGLVSGAGGLKAAWASMGAGSAAAGGAGGLMGGLSAFGMSMPQLTLAVAAATAATQLFADTLVDSALEHKDIKLKAEQTGRGIEQAGKALSKVPYAAPGSASEREAMLGAKGSARAAMTILRDSGLVGAGGGFNQTAAIAQIREMGGEERRGLLASVGSKGSIQFPDEIARTLETAVNQLNMILGTKEAQTPFHTIKPLTTTKAPNVGPFTGDIYITQDFKDQDPDRVFIGFKNALEREATAKTQWNTAEFAAP